MLNKFKALIATVIAVCLITNGHVFAAKKKMSVVTGKIVEVVPSKKEIYVRDEKQDKHEYYFNDHTEIFHGEEKQSFSTLQTGQQVKVTAWVIGKRLDPVKVEVLE